MSRGRSCARCQREGRDEPRVGQSPDEPAIVDGSGLRFREYAALTHHASLLVGCSSGLTWVCTSDAARTLPTLQVLTQRVGMCGAVVHDLEHWGLPSDHVIEMRDCQADAAAACVVDMLANGVAHARAAFHQRLDLTLGYYYTVMLPLLRRGQVATVVESMRNVVERYGLRRELLVDLARQVAGRMAKRSPLKS